MHPRPPFLPMRPNFPTPPHPQGIPGFPLPPRPPPYPTPPPGPTPSTSALPPRPPPQPPVFVPGATPTPTPVPAPVPTPVPAPPPPEQRTAPPLVPEEQQLPPPAEDEAITTKRFHAYFTPQEVAELSARQRGKIAERKAEGVRKMACGFLESLGGSLGFPRRTIATAQVLYHRFHLFYPLKDFAFYDVATACLFVSSKMHDTLKKLREILIGAFAIRHPELVGKTTKGEVAVDDATLESERKRLLGIERLVLETISFSFNVRQPFTWVIKFGRAMGASQQLSKLAFKIAIDSHRTLAPLIYPPHILALAALYLAALLSSSPPGARLPPTEGDHLAAMLQSGGVWEERWLAEIDDVEDAVHMYLDLFLADNSPPPGGADLTRLKIGLREAEGRRKADPGAGLGKRKRRLSDGAVPGVQPVREEVIKVVGAGLDAAKANEGTTRFLFG